MCKSVNKYFYIFFDFQLFLQNNWKNLATNFFKCRLLSLSQLGVKPLSKSRRSYEKNENRVVKSSSKESIGLLHPNFTEEDLKEDLKDEGKCVQAKENFSFET